MATQSIPPVGEEEGEGASIGKPAKGGDEVYAVPSFTDARIKYQATPAGWCDCPRYEHTKECIKHPFYAEQLQLLERFRFFRPTQQDKAVLFSLVRRIFADEKKESPQESARLVEDCNKFYFSNRLLRWAARERHKRVLCAHENRRAA